MRRPDDTKIWQGSDYRGRTVSLYQNELDHILSRSIMDENRHAVYDTVTDPQSVYQSEQDPAREVMFRYVSTSSYNDDLLTKVVVDYNDSEDPYIVTSFPTERKGGGLGDKLYP